jgi:hypothetical protein
VAGQLGYCGLDRQRRPLRGDEIRACWEGGAAVTDSPAAGIPRSAPATGLDDDRTPVRRLEFVEVRSGTGAPRGKAAATKSDGSGPKGGKGAAPGDPSVEVRAPEPGWSLWGDTDL